MDGYLESSENLLETHIPIPIPKLGRRLEVRISIPIELKKLEVSECGIAGSVCIRKTATDMDTTMGSEYRKRFYRCP